MDERTLAIINAVGTTISIIMAAYAVFIVHRDRKPRLRVKAMWMQHRVIRDNIIDPSPSQNLPEYKLRFYASNIGSVPVILYGGKVISKDQSYAGVTFGYHTDGSPAIEVDFPYKLDPGERLTVLAEYPFEIENLVSLSETTKQEGYFILTDGTGREYKTKIVRSLKAKKMRRLFKEFFHKTLSGSYLSKQS